MAHNLHHLGPPTEAMWQDLGTVTLDPQLNAAIIAGLDAELRDDDLPTMVAQRNAAPLQLLKIKARSGNRP